MLSGDFSIDFKNLSMKTVLQYKRQHYNGPSGYGILSTEAKCCDKSLLSACMCVRA